MQLHLTIYIRINTSYIIRRDVILYAYECGEYSSPHNAVNE